MVDIVVAGESPRIIYAATGSGGIWKSPNEGTTWEPIFDHEGVAAMGAVAVDAANPETIWAGSGEANPRNSVSWGNGVYKSTNGGRSWTNMGLADSRHIGRIRVDPRNADTVYVAALGHIWGPNKERGVFKTTDGGVTWSNSLFINEDTGVVDLTMDPNDSNTLYAAAYEVRRDGFPGGDPEKGWGPGSGIYKTTNGGRTWRKLAQGLPTGPLGRIGLDVARTNPGIVYAVIQTPSTAAAENAGDGPPPPPNPNAPAKTMKDGGVFRSDDRGETWRWVNPLNLRPFYYSQVRVDPTNENHVYTLATANNESWDGGVTFKPVTENIHVDHHALWMDPKNPRHQIDGNDGGIYMTWDGGRTWDFQNQMALSQLYSVDVDMRKPYFIYGGSQDYCSWGGPSATRNAVGIKYADWFKVQTGDGFQVRPDPADYNIVYAESQNGGLIRHDLKSGRNTAIKPRARTGKPAYRFNWETPVFLSAHDSKTVYMGGNFVFKSTNRGDVWSEISPELTTNRKGTVASLAESPMDARVLYAGTDDGNVWVTRDSKTWSDITAKVPGMPGKRWVSRLAASRYEAGTVYLAFDGHRSDDIATYLFRSTDYGQTWQSIKGDLPPAMPVRVIREDVKNRSLWFAGTEGAAYASLDGGTHWVPLSEGLPTVPVADLIVHPRDGDLIAATHGRSFWILDISPLQEMTPAVLSSDVHLFSVKPAMAFDYRVFTNDEFLAEKRFIAQNPAPGTTISYYLKSAAEGDVKLAILDQSGVMVRELTAKKDKGLNRIQWDLRGKPLSQTQRPGGGRGGVPPPAEGGPGPTTQNQGAIVDAGTYVAQLTVGGKTYKTTISVEPDTETSVSDADRATRRTLISTLYTLQSKTDPASARAEALDTQLNALSRSLENAPQVPGEAKAALAEAIKEAGDLRVELARVNRSVSQAFGQVSGSPFLPTATQREEAEDLQVDFDNRSAALDKLLQEVVPKMEKQLDAAGISRVIVR